MGWLRYAVATSKPLGSGTRLTLWTNIGHRFIAMGAAGWHICFDVLDRLLGGTPIGRIVGPDAMTFGGWQRALTRRVRQAVRNRIAQLAASGGSKIMKKWRTMNHERSNQTFDRSLDSHRLGYSHRSATSMIHLPDKSRILCPNCPVCFRSCTRHFGIMDVERPCRRLTASYESRAGDRHSLALRTYDLSAGG